MAGVRVQVALKSAESKQLAEMLHGNLAWAQPTSEEVRLFGLALSQDYASSYEMRSLKDFLERMVDDLDRDIKLWNSEVAKAVRAKAEEKAENAKTIVQARLETKAKVVRLQDEVSKALALSEEAKPLFTKYFRTETEVAL